ncbi:hypothetical protein KQI65_16090 [bacterium]|nr:hypothetical protein [bacterium]
MRKMLFSIMIALPLLTAGAYAQDPGATMTMVCPTTDGTVTINEQAVTLADYHLQFDNMLADGVVRYTDHVNNVSAVLDAREDEGLYLSIEDNGITMQVVAARSNISYRFDHRGSEPSAPSWSALNQYIKPAKKN